MVDSETKLIFMALYSAFLLFSPAAFAEEDCKGLFELYGECYKMGLENSDPNTCKEAVNKLLDEAVNQTENTEDAENLAVIGAICESACEKASKNKKIISYENFKKEFCE